MQLNDLGSFYDGKSRMLYDRQDYNDIETGRLSSQMNRLQKARSLYGQFFHQNFLFFKPFFLSSEFAVKKNKQIGVKRKSSNFRVTKIFYFFTSNIFYTKGLFYFLHQNVSQQK